MLQFMEEKEEFLANKGNIIVSITSAVVMMLFRNNGMYAYVVWAALLGAVCLFVKKKRKARLKMLLIKPAVGKWSLTNSLSVKNFC